MFPKGAERYKSVQVTTSSPGGLLILLYDGLFRYLAEASAALRSNDYARSGERIDRSHAILGELVAGLQFDAFPELCERLEAIYFFCMGHLIEANLHRDPNRVDEVARVLAPVREAFTIAVRGQQASAPMMASAGAL